MRRLTTTLFAVLATLLVAVPAQAQQLERVMEQVASSWARGDVRSLTRFAADDGLSLDVQHGPVGPLAARQAAAALRKVFDDRETVSVKPGMTRVVGGTPQRAFGEIEWVTRTRGTTIPVRQTVFVALVREGDEWRVTEIRLMQ